MTQNNKIIFLIITIVVILFSFAFGFIIGVKIFKNQNAPAITELSKDKILEIKRQTLDDLRAEQLLPSLPNELYRLDGRIASIGQDFLILEPRKDKGLNPLGLTFPNTLKIQFSENTIFYNADWKSKEQYDEEQKIYLTEIERREQAGESLDGLIQPDMLSYSNIPDTALKAGDYVRVVSESNILGKEDVEAKEVQVINKIVEDNSFLK
jgi:hypothetical protein